MRTVWKDGGDQAHPGDKRRLPSAGVSRSVLIACASAGALALPPAAMAQDTLQSVKDRPRPAFQSQPIRVNSLQIRPRIDVRTEYVENIFVEGTGGSDAVILSVLPGVGVSDNRPDRRLSLDASAGYDTYLDGDVDDRWRLDLRSNARFGIGTLTRTFAGLNIRRNDTSRNSIGDFRTFGQPIELTAIDGNIGIERDIGNFVVTGEGLYYLNNYDGDLVIGGERFEDPVPDRDVIGVRGRVAYEFQPQRRIYVEALYNRRDFDIADADADLPPDLLLDRSSDDVGFNVGVVQRLTDLLYLDANIGVISRDFEDETLDEPSRFTFDARLAWNPTRLTSLQLQASRSVDTFTGEVQSGVLRNQITLAAQHELLRNLILDAAIRYAETDSDLAFVEGEVIGGRIGAQYLISPKWSLNARAERFERTSLFEGAQNRFQLGLRYNF